MKKKSPSQVSQLEPSPKNPRTITDQQLEALGCSMREFGDLSGLVFNIRTGHMVGGHQRLKHLSPKWKIERKPQHDKVGTVAVGYIETPFGKFTYREVDWPESTELAANVAANKILGEWDRKKLAPLLEELAPLPEFDLTGFSRQEANLLIENFPAIEKADENDVPEFAGKASANVGDLYKLGNHRLLCGDAADPNVWRRLLDGRKAAMVFTDPPYGVSYDNTVRFMKNPVTGKIAHHDKDWGPVVGDQTVDAALNVLPLIFANLADNGVAYICSGTKLAVTIANWLDANQVHYAPFLIWVKGHFVVTWERYHNQHELIIYCGPGSGPTGAKSRWFGPQNETTVWEIQQELGHDRAHPTQKPVSLYERALINSSVRGEIVVDPFAGSGTCLIAAEKHGRSAYCIELDPRYVDVAVRRWERLTGAKAERNPNFVTRDNSQRE